MKLTVAQKQAYQGDDRWKWAVWIEGTNTDLDEIKEVTYKLHPTFPNPLRTVSDRSTKFMLESSGWGTFTIHVKVLLKGGSVLTLKRDLELFYEEGTPAAD
jgi:transcription initiation factor IIF auxiliary subunit